MSREALETDRLQDIERREQNLEELMRRAENLLTELEKMVCTHLLEHEAEREMG